MTMVSALPAFHVDYVNPVIQATRNVFETMLNCSPRRSGLSLAAPLHSDVSAVIGITGRASGTLVVSFSAEVAARVLYRMIGTETNEVTAEVCDAVGELANMVAGAAKAQLAALELSLSIPNIVTGKNHAVRYQSDVQPIYIEFSSEIGPFQIEVGFTSPK